MLVLLCINFVSDVSPEIKEEIKIDANQTIFVLL